MEWGLPNLSLDEQFELVLSELAEALLCGDPVAEGLTDLAMRIRSRQLLRLTADDVNFNMTLVSVRHTIDRGIEEFGSDEGQGP